MLTSTHKIVVVIDTSRRWERGAKPGPKLCDDADALMAVVNNFLDTKCEQIKEPASPQRVDRAAIAEAMFRRA